MIERESLLKNEVHYWCMSREVHPYTIYIYDENSLQEQTQTAHIKIFFFLKDKEKSEKLIGQEKADEDKEAVRRRKDRTR